MGMERKQFRKDFRLTIMRSVFLLPFFLLFACHSSETEDSSTPSASLQALSDQDYPDNPDRALRHPQFEKDAFDRISFLREDETHGRFVMISATGDDTLSLGKLDWSVWMPRLQPRLLKDQYLSYIGIVNQEWNRHQVTLRPDQIHFSGDPDQRPQQVDVARNCLHSGLWEVILYEEHEGHQAPTYHGWFHFPDEMYRELFNSINPIPFEEYEYALTDWADPELNPVDVSALRQPEREMTLPISSHNEEDYPLTGERKKKFSNIIYPPNTNRIADFLTDSTLFATFTPPGIYTRSDPRKTELGRLAYPESCTGRSWTGENGETRLEIEINYGKDDHGRRTNWYISGLLGERIPRLKEKHVDHGLQRPMGIGNPSFYQTYDEAKARSPETDPYFSILTDGDGRWLDSHAVGIDGPLLHWDASLPYILHVWVLSFERHAMVGHYTIDTRPLIKMDEPDLHTPLCYLFQKDMPKTKG